MSYREALEAAGANVVDYKEFGSYQGTWFAVVEKGGEKLLIEGGYGSCSGCDSFEAEFGFKDGPEVFNYETGKYEPNPEYPEKLKAFGESYLNQYQTLDEAVSVYRKRCENDYAWEDDKEILSWLEGLKVQND